MPVDVTTLPQHGHLETDNKYIGMVTLKALANSINTISAKLMDKVGPEAVKLTHKLGMKSEIPIQPSIALGADITVEDMVAAYSTFANQGVYTKPQFYRIEDKSGVIIYEPIPESHDVLNKDIAFAIIKLEGVTEGGSGNRLRTEWRRLWIQELQDILINSPIQLQVKQEQRKTSLTVGLWEWFQIW
jgi:membrane peptidoglycan carboxypeptidase